MSRDGRVDLSLLVIAGPLLACLGLPACSGNSSGTTELVADEFTSAAVSPQPPPGPGGNSGAGSSDLEAEVREADLVQMVDDTLYALSSYRSLTIIDLQDPSELRVLHRMPLPGRPMEMILHDDRAVVILHDVSAPWVPGAEPGAMGNPRSRILFLDNSDPSRPVLLSTHDVDGHLSDTRMVGDMLYTLLRYWPSWPPAQGDEPMVAVLSHELVAGTVHEIARLELGIDPTNLHVQVTDHSIIAASTHYENPEIHTDFRYVDISDPSGTPHLGAQFSLPGIVHDRWQMSEHLGIFRVVVEHMSERYPSLHTFAIHSPQQIIPLADLDIELPRPERLTDVRFDGERAFVVTVERVDPLFTLDLSDPANPTQEGELEMSGWLDFIVPRGDRLIALGHDDASDTLELAVSLIDISDLSNPLLLRRQSFGQGWITDTRDNLAKVFRVLDDLGLIIMPFQAMEQDPAGNWVTEGRVQLLDLDLANDSIQLRGNLPTASIARRALACGEDILTVSETQVRRFSISDRDLPLQTARCDLARNVRDVVFLPPFAVQLVDDRYPDGSRLVLLPADDLDARTPLAELKLDLVAGSRLLLYGDDVYAVGLVPEDSTTRRLQQVHLADPLQPVLGNSMDVPGATCRGLASAWWSDSDAQCGFDCVVQVNDSTLVFHEHATPAGNPPPVPGPPSMVGKYHMVDLNQAHAPVLASTVTLDGVQESFCPKVFGDQLYLRHSETVTDPSELPGAGYAGLVRHYVTKVDLSRPASPRLFASLNTPGLVFSVNADGRHAFLLDHQWHKTGLIASLCAMDLTYPKADGVQRIEVGDSFWIRARRAGEQAILWDFARSSLKSFSLLPRLSPNGAATIPVGGGAFMEATEQHAFLQSYSPPGIVIYGLSDRQEPEPVSMVNIPDVHRLVLRDRKAYFMGGYYGIRVLGL